MPLKLVSFSLYGNERKYNWGAIVNALEMPKIYPGWTMRVYCADDVDANELQRLGCQIERMGVSHDQSGMLWRFLPLWEEGVERVIFRDADSIINPKEAAAVEAWIQSGKTAHMMHDHPHHCSMPVMGGMWGCRGNMVPHMTAEWMRWMSSMKRRVADMSILSTYIYPHIKDSVMRHSSQPLQWPYEPFPPFKDKFDGFIGQQHDNSPEWAPVWP